MKSINVKLPEDLHTRIKKEAAEKDTYMKDYIILLLQKATSTKK